MSYYFKNLQPSYDSDEDEDVNEMDLGDTLKKVTRRQNQKTNDDDNESEEGDESEDDDDDDEMQTLSFGSLKKAESLLAKEEKQSRQEERTSKKTTLKSNKSVPEKKENITRKVYKEESFEESDSDSESDGAFFEEEEEENSSKRSHKKGNNKRHKHAPAESSSKKRVSKIRDIPGLELPSNRNPSLYGDIRFNKALGGVDTDSSVIRRRYQFLDEYREKEIAEMEALLHDRKFLQKVSDKDKEEMESKVRSMKSRLQSIKNKELENKIVKDYEKELNQNNKSKFHLKQAEKRKVIQKWKFDHMKAKQREKVMERKRKKRLGKEFKQFEFHNRG